MAGARTQSRSFDAAFYRRFYEDRRTAVSDAREVHRLCEFVLAYLRFLRIPVRSVLDVGCGLGRWKKALARQRPGISYLGVEVSDYLCDRFGWRKGSAVDYSPGRRFDLVICQSVLQYLGDEDAERAIANLARLCRGALYLEVLTRGDWESNCDRRRTDGNVNLRQGSWYRRRLARGFWNCGGGVFVRRTRPVALYELEALP
ncbi:MAG: class I SAM-dependent methyltransferase [Planctomycetota bacterium]